MIKTHTEPLKTILILAINNIEVFSECIIGSNSLAIISNLQSRKT